MAKKKSRRAKKKEAARRATPRRTPRPSWPKARDLDPRKRTLEIDILSWWHPGTGRGDGAITDAVVHLDDDGLPQLPGRTVKGLIRRAVLLGIDAGLPGLPDDVVTSLFGSQIPEGIHADDRIEALEEARFVSQKAALHISNARLGATADEQAAWRAWAHTNEDAPRWLETLVGDFSSTRLQNGVAADQSLRNIQVLAPMKLHAFLTAEGNDFLTAEEVPWSSIHLALRLFLRSLGSHRNRGFGRARAALVEEAI
jgi:hypothetical protein